MSPENKNIIKRIGILYWLIILLGILIIGQVAALQLNDSLKQEGVKISYREEKLTAIRGNILANDGRILATSLPYYEIRMDCVTAPDSVFDKNISGLASSLANFFRDKNAEQYKNEIIKARNSNGRYKKIGNRLVDYTELQFIKKFPIFNMGTYRGGFIVEQRHVRKNPYNRLAFRTIGWVNAEGTAVGIEGAFDYYLRGIPGARMVKRIPGGDWMPVNSEVDIAPHNGYDVVSCIDVDIQDAAETALRRQLASSPVFEAGTAIVMEVKTGEIRAIANMKRNADGSYDESFNYAIGNATEPGSTFKLATLISLLEDNKVDLETPINTGNGVLNYSGQNIRDVTSGGYGTIPVIKVFEKSSNVGFAKMAIDYYKGREKQFVNHLYAMKFNEKLNLQIMGEATPTVRYPSDKLWSNLSLPWMAIGYEVLITPMQTLTLYNAIANDGKMVKPKFVKELRRQGSVIKRYPTEVLSSSICSPATLRKVKLALEAVVKEGTARNINDSTRYSIAGKTGTAQMAFEGVYTQNGYRKHQASFVGFFPSDKPKYTAIVVLYSEKTQSNFYGGTWAAPVFKQIADKLYISSPDWNNPVEPAAQYADMPVVKSGKKIEVDEVLDKLKIPSQRISNDNIWIGVKVLDDYVEEVPRNITNSTVPSVFNMGLKDALFILENLGLNVSFSGKGRVMTQSLPEGAPLVKGQNIHLDLDM